MKKTIKKVKLNGGGLEVTFSEYNNENDYTNDISLKCPQIVHKDLQAAMDKLKSHVALICEFPEKKFIESSGIDDMPNEISNILITGFTTGGSDESAGACIIAQRILPSGKVLNIVTPFMQYTDEEYAYAGELNLAVEGCEYEVLEYLDKGKFGVKQLDLDFDEHDNIDKQIVEAEMTDGKVSIRTIKRERKKKEEEPAETF